MVTAGLNWTKDLKNEYFRKPSSLMTVEVVAIRNLSPLLVEEYIAGALEPLPASKKSCEWML